MADENSTLKDILGGASGLATGAASVISAIKGTPQSVTYVTTTPNSSTISPTLLIGGGLVMFLVLIMVLKHE